MNPELQKQLAAMLAQAQDATTWATAQLPPLVHEKIMLGRVEEIIYLLLSLGLLGLAVKLLCFAYPWDEDREGESIAAAACGGIISVAATCMLIMSIHASLTAWFAPRVYIVEWLASFVGK